MVEVLRKCRVSDVCGGCQLQHLSYPQQLEYKQKFVEKQIGRFGKVKPVMACENPYHYRNKVQYAFGKDYRGRMIYGNYVVSTHQIVPVKDCQLANENANKIVETIRDLAVSFKIPVFDEVALRGCLRHVLIRTSNKTNEIMVVLVTGTFAIPHKRDFINVLLKKHPEITTIINNVNNRHTSMVLGEKSEILFGKGYIEDELCDCLFRISAKSFYQVNSVQTANLYNKAIELAKFKGDETVVDAYCGIGTISLIVAKKVKKVLGVEINPVAIKDAKKNAKINNISNVDFMVNDAGKYMQSLAQEKVKIDAVIMDPPRAGADEKFMNSVIRLAPDKVVYISCNPVTLKENLIYFSKHGYTIKEMQPVDMFPFSEHIETIVLLVKK